MRTENSGTAVSKIVSPTHQAFKHCPFVASRLDQKHRKPSQRPTVVDVTAFFEKKTNSTTKKVPKISEYFNLVIFISGLIKACGRFWRLLGKPTQTSEVP